MGTSQNIQIVYDDLVYQQIMHWVYKAKHEVSGLGVVVVERNDGITTLRVTKAIILQQKNTSVHTEMDATAVGKAEFDHYKSGEPGELRLWWHSHVTMPVFWSSEDRATINELSAPGWFCATVFNKKNEWRSAYSCGGAVPLLVDEIHTDVDREIPKDLTDTWDASYDSAVSIETQLAPVWVGYSNGKFGGGAKDPKHTMARDDWEQAWLEAYGYQSQPSVDFSKKDDRDLPEGMVDDTVISLLNAQSSDDAATEALVDRLMEKQLAVLDSIREACAEAGLSEDEAAEIGDKAERLFDDGRYSIERVEQLMIAKVIAKQADVDARKQGRTL